MAGEKQGLVFISCGQYRPEEKQLGQDLAAVVSELTPFEGYFAENQNSLDGLSRNIFGALNRCCGFVGVMHHRGQLTTPERNTRIRGSVWVEQEVAIAAFLKQAQGRDIQVVVYVQRGISREGVRDQLHLNPIEFDTEGEVLTEFRQRVIRGQFAPNRLPQPKDAEIRVGYRTLSRGGGGVHQYRLEVFVKNVGTDPLTEYWVELFFPKTVLESSNTIFAAEVRQRQTSTHRFFRVNQEHTGRELYPDDEILALSIDYQMNHDILYHKGAVLGELVIAVLGLPGMSPKRIEKPFREFQEF